MPTIAKNAPRLRDHGEKLSDGHEEMELEDIENIILGDGTVLKGQLPANFPVQSQGHYECDVNIHAQLSSHDETVTDIRITHLQTHVTLQSAGHTIHANPDGSYTVPTNGHVTLVSSQPISGSHHYFATEVTTHNSATGVSAVTTEDLQGHTHSHINPPPPPPPPVLNDEPMDDNAVADGESLTIMSALGISDVTSGNDDHQQHDASKYLDKLGITQQEGLQLQSKARCLMILILYLMTRSSMILRPNIKVMWRIIVIKMILSTSKILIMIIKICKIQHYQMTRLANNKTPLFSKGVG